MKKVDGKKGLGVGQIDPSPAHCICCGTYTRIRWSCSRGSARKPSKNSFFSTYSAAVNSLFTPNPVGLSDHFRGTSCTPVVCPETALPTGPRGSRVGAQDKINVRLGHAVYAKISR